VLLAGGGGVVPVGVLAVGVLVVGVLVVDVLVAGVLLVVGFLAIGGVCLGGFGGRLVFGGVLVWVLTTARAGAGAETATIVAAGCVGAL
jgi:hypothetical protein